MGRIRAVHAFSLNGGLPMFGDAELFTGIQVSIPAQDLLLVLKEKKDFLVQEYQEAMQSVSPQEANQLYEAMIADGHEITRTEFNEILQHGDAHCREDLQEEIEVVDRMIRWVSRQEVWTPGVSFPLSFSDVAYLEDRRPHRKRRLRQEED